MTRDTSSSPKAVLRFLPDGQQAGEGAILRGESVAIEFAPERLTGCRLTRHGAEVWDIEAFAKFHPRGELLRGSVLDRVRTGGGGTALVPKPLEFAGPK